MVSLQQNGNSEVLLIYAVYKLTRYTSLASNIEISDHTFYLTMPLNMRISNTNDFIVGNLLKNQAIQIAKIESDK